jgi:hypothetical protein
MEEHNYQKAKWQNWYTLVLIANAIYIIIFYFLTATFS